MQRIVFLLTQMILLKPREVKWLSQAWERTDTISEIRKKQIKAKVGQRWGKRIRKKYKDEDEGKATSHWPQGETSNVLPGCSFGPSVSTDTVLPHPSLGWAEMKVSWRLLQSGLVQLPSEDSLGSDSYHSNCWSLARNLAVSVVL